MCETLALSLVGLDAQLVRVRAVVGAGAGPFEIAGLRGSQARELRVRVQGALRQIGIEILERAVSVAFSPSDLPLSGAIDLAVAITILIALGAVPESAVVGTLLFGELSITGAMRAAYGVLPGLRGAARLGIARAVVAQANAREAANVPGIEVLVADDLRQVIALLCRETASASVGPRAEASTSPMCFPERAEGPLPSHVRRALEIAAGGAHPLLLVGSPKAGKAAIVRCLPAILPPLTSEEVLEVTAIHSVAGLISADLGVIGSRPFRAPHHTVSAAGLVGGGELLRPGEVSLAHLGVLFLDEVLEFWSSVLDALGGPLEAGQVTICRAGAQSTFPAKPLLVAASSSCPCGLAGARSGRCTCSPERRGVYEARLGGPWFDRFGVRVDVSEIRGRPSGEPSQDTRDRVVAARVLQTERARLGATAQTNAALSLLELERFAQPDSAGERALGQATERLHLSTAARHRALRVARTIADLDGSEVVRAPHIAEALEASLLRAPGPTTPL